MSAFIKNIGNPLRIYCNGAKIKIGKGLTKVSDDDLKKLESSDFYKRLVNSEILKIDTPKPKVDTVDKKVKKLAKKMDNDDD
jgi:hypothetical protein